MFKAFDVEQSVKYGTFSQISEMIINQKGNVRELVTQLVNNNTIVSKYEHKKGKKNSYRILLVDQVDTFFSKDFYGNTYNPSALLTSKQIKSLIEYIWSIQQENSDHIFKLLSQTNEYKHISQKFPDIIDKINFQFRIMINDLKIYNKRQYVVQNRKIGYKQLDGVSTNTVYGYQTMFQYMYEYKRGNVDQIQLNKQLGISLACGRFSYAEMIQEFDKIFGVSGTLKSLSQYETKILKRYKITQKTFAPSVYGKSLRQEKNILIQQGSKHFQTVAQNIIDRLNKQQAILVFFENQRTLNDFYKSDYCSQFRNKAKIVTQKCTNRDILIKTATSSSTVTLFTSSFGRGTDFVVFDPIVKQNGVDVIQTFYSEQLSQQIQIKGRTARQGSRGSYQLILSANQLQKKFKVTIDMIKKAEQSAQDSVGKLLHRKRQEFLKIKNQLRQKQIDKAKQLHNKSIQIRDLIIQNKIKRDNQFFFDSQINSNSLYTHYIFVLDDSGSMSGQKWKDLMIAFSNTIGMIKSIPESQKSTKVSILIQGSTCKIHQQNSPPNQINQNVIPRLGGNNFRDTFGKAYNLMNKYVQQCNIRYIFMTDGGDRYPEVQVKKIKELKQKYPGKISYYGIQFQTSGQTMVQISKQLDGKNTISNDVNELTSAFAQTISRKR